MTFNPTGPGSASLQQWTTTGTGPLTTVTSFNGGATFASPAGVAVDPSTGDLYVANSAVSQVEVFDPTGNYLTRLDVAGKPFGVGVNQAGTTLYADDNANNACYAWPITPGAPPTYGAPVTFGNSGPGQLSQPEFLHLDGSGNLWVADYGNARVVEYDPTGAYVSSITPGIGPSPNPFDVALDGLGNVYMVLTGDGYVDFSDPPTGPTENIALGSYPLGICFDGAGHFYVSYGGSDNRIVGYQKN